MDRLSRVELCRKKHFSTCPYSADQILLWCSRSGTSLLFPEDYPPLLQEIVDIPPWIFVQGDVGALFQRPLLALVGTRRPCVYGLRAAHFFAKELVRRGFILVSGLARGIDGIAHTASVLANCPTIAVLGHGLDQIYPKQHSALASDIVEKGGCLVSEFPPGIGVQAFHFPRRNRILSGLAMGCLVIEAGLKSGSLITARHALEQNREVFVIPGPYFEKGFEGSHRLLQEGAKLVFETGHILEEFGQTIFAVEKPGLDAEPLRAFFQEHSVATLARLVEQNLPNLAEALESARKEGWIVEVAPQSFVYAGG